MQRLGGLILSQHATDADGDAYIKESSIAGVPGEKYTYAQAVANGAI